MRITNLNEDYLDKLPYSISKSKYLTQKHKSLYNLKRWDHPWLGYSKISKLLYRILDNNIGKSFDMAFHYYCTKVPQQYQYLFLQEFERIRKYSYWGYYLDIDNNIQYRDWSYKNKRFKFNKKDKKSYYEKLSKDRKQQREYKLYKEQYNDELLSKIVFKEKEIINRDNLTKIISHGFDPITSFRNIKN